MARGGGRRGIVPAGAGQRGGMSEETDGVAAALAGERRLLTPGIRASRERAVRCWTRSSSRWGPPAAAGTGRRYSPGCRAWRARRKRDSGTGSPACGKPRRLRGWCG